MSKKTEKLCPGCDKPLYQARVQSRYGHGEICSRRMFAPVNCAMREEKEGDFITKDRWEAQKESI